MSVPSFQEPYRHSKRRLWGQIRPYTYVIPPQRFMSNKAWALAQNIFSGNFLEIGYTDKS